MAKHAKRAGGKKLNKEQIKEVKKIISVRQELKYSNIFFNAIASTTTASILLLTDIAQGNTDSTRNGDKLMLSRYFDLRYIWTIGDQSNFVRTIIFQWKPQGGPLSYTPTPADILFAGSTGIIDVDSMYLHDTRSQYTILYDKVHALAGNGTFNPAGTTIYPYTGMSFIYVHKRIKIPRLQVQFESAGSTTMTNGIYVIYVSDSQITPNPKLTLNAMFKFTDS